jgi:deoxycytidine triphosphate deaminase
MMFPECKTLAPRIMKPPKVYFIQLGFEAKLKSLCIMEVLRKARIPVHQSVAKDSLSAQLAIAEKMEVPYCIIFGQKEAMDRTVKLAVSIGEGTTTPRWEEYHTPFNIRRGQFLLASIKERFVCTRELFLKDGYHCFAPMFEGRSTLARMGLQTHLSAGFGDYGFEGVFTLEICNMAPWDIELVEGMRIGQVSFHEVYEPLLYTGNYNDDRGPGEPRKGNW